MPCSKNNPISMIGLLLYFAYGKARYSTYNLYEVILYSIFFLGYDVVNPNT